MYIFRHLVVYLQQMFPACRPRVTGCWDLLHRWELAEPVSHRPPLPKMLLDAMLSLALCWGWKRWAAVTAVAFHGAMRVGEPLRACRRDLLLPEEACLSVEVCFLNVQNPKAGRRGRGQVQHARISDTSAVALCRAAFGSLPPDELLFPAAAATYRRRWDHLLASLYIAPSLRLTPGCLRGGGAVHLYHQDTPVADILWRMRLRHLVTLEHYLQETAALNVMQQLPENARSRIQTCASMYVHNLRPFITT